MHWQILSCHLKSLPFSKPTSLAFMKHYILFQKVTLLRFKKFHLIIQNVDGYIFEAIISLYSPVTSSTSLYNNYLRQFLIFWWNFLKIYAEKSALLQCDMLVKRGISRHSKKSRAWIWIVYHLPYYISALHCTLLWILKELAQIWVFYGEKPKV